MTQQPIDAAPATIDRSEVTPQATGATLLADLRGRWVGEGINTLWVPTLDGGVSQQATPPTYNPPGQPPKPVPQFVSSRTTETLVIEDVLGAVPNKGSKEAFSELAAPYEQRVHDENGSLIHVESGYWLVTPSTQESATPSVAKLASIPHGTVALVQGPLSDRQPGTAPVPTPSPASVMPSTPLDGLSQPSGPLDPEFIANVASYVQRRFEADHAGVLWQLTLTGTGADVANIDFLKTNAPVTSVQSTFWVGNLGIRADGQGEQSAAVLAYVQTVLIQFDGIQWPHVSVGYLTRDMDFERS